MESWLPICAVREKLIEAYRRQSRMILTAPTGSGKSTQVPQMLLDGDVLDSGRIVILQPRRLAARLLAARVATERGGRLGDEIGYQVRLEDVSSSRTRIKYETEGLLLRQLASNPTLRGVAAIVFDEFHERHLHADLMLARALHLQRTARPDLRLIVMSATLDAPALAEHLAPCARLDAPGRAYPVDIAYLDKPVDRLRETPWLAARDAFESLARSHSPDELGDILVFMPGAFEIRRTLEALAGSPAARGWRLLPLHGELPPAQQDAAVTPGPDPRIVVATNVAETSITIPGIRTVIDSGLARVARHDPVRGINTLLVERISRASADQRAGRAGRTAPGLCLRLWTRHEHEGRAAHDTPEIARLELSEAVLDLKAGGIVDIAALPWFEPPPARALAQAHALLEDLGALDSDTGALTPVGADMAEFPVHPRYARLLIEARAAPDAAQVLPAAALVAALSQGRPVLQRRRDSLTREDRELFLGDEEVSDFFLHLRAWAHAARHQYDPARCERLGIHALSARQATETARVFLRLAGCDAPLTPDMALAPAALPRCLLCAFADHLARREAGSARCRLVHGRKGELARDCGVRGADLLVAAEVRETQGAGPDTTVQLSMITAVREEWLTELWPGAFKRERVAVYDDATRRVYEEQRESFRDLVLRTRRGDKPDPAAAGRLLAEQVLKGRLMLEGWNHRVEQWLLRAAALRQACPELGVPEFGEAERRLVIEMLCADACAYKDIKDRPVEPLVREYFGATVGQIEKLMPERFTLANDRSFRVTYGGDPPATISARIQELYGVTEAPRLARGRIPVTVQILAPSQRPVQVTRDLAGFWTEHYPRLKKELQRKYPKHEWR